MIIDLISDLHGEFPELAGGDLLIVAGDLVGSLTRHAYDYFANWLHQQKYTKKIFIAGNHDTFLEKEVNLIFPYQGMFEIESEVVFLYDSGIEFEGLKIWGSPWTKSFEGVNPHCKAFMLDSEEELLKKWKLIPDDIDILVTHSPPYHILDKTKSGEHVGSESLVRMLNHIRPKLHVFGHIHECGGQTETIPLFHESIVFVNASIVNEDYEHVNKPVRVIL